MAASHSHYIPPGDEGVGSSVDLSQTLFRGSILAHILLEQKHDVDSGVLCHQAGISSLELEHSVFLFGIDGIIGCSCQISSVHG